MPAISTNKCDVPLPYVILENEIVSIPECFLYRYYSKTGILLNFDFYKGEDGHIYTRNEFLLTHHLYEDSNGIVHEFEYPNPNSSDNGTSDSSLSTTGGYVNPNVTITARNANEGETSPIPMATSGYIAPIDEAQINENPLEGAITTTASSDDIPHTNNADRWHNHPRFKRNNSKKK